MQDLVLAWLPLVGALGPPHPYLSAGWSAPAVHLASFVGLTSSVMQLLILQAREKPVAGPLWLGLGLGLSLAVWGTFVSAVPALPHMAASVIGGAARYLKTLRTASGPGTLNIERLSPTSRAAFGELKP